MINNNSIHIGFDVSQTGFGKAGCGYFAHALIQALLELAPKNRYALYPHFGDFYFDRRMPIRNPYKKGAYGPRHFTRRSATAFWSSKNLEALLKKPDLIHSNNFWCPLQLESSRLIYTFYDLGFVIDPQWTTEANRLGCFEGIFRSSVTADWIVAISEASRRDYLQLFPHFPEDRIRVIYPCSRFAYSKLKASPPPSLSGIATNKFWLSVGTIEPRKNQRLLAKAYAQYLKSGGEPMPLVFAGGNGWLMEDFHHFLRELKIESHILFTGYVSDKELLWLYQNCYANLYPSLFEGFGLPVLEGMQFGAPTITSSSSSLPEVAGEAAIVLPAEDCEAWSQTMLRLASNKSEKDRLSLAGKEQAQRFSWKQSASFLLELYSEALASPKRKQTTKSSVARIKI